METLEGELEVEYVSDESAYDDSEEFNKSFKKENAKQQEPETTETRARGTLDVTLACAGGIYGRSPRRGIRNLESYFNMT